MGALPVHTTKSAVEKALCDEMGRQGVSHEHASLHFRVRLASGETAQYEPRLVARRGPILFLIESVADLEGDRAKLGLLASFLDQHSPEIVLVVVGPKGVVDALPASCYDEVYPSEDLSRVVGRIREQDPQGMVRPFPKPRA